MNQKSKIIAIFILGALMGMLIMYLVSNYKIEKKISSIEAAISTNEDFKSSEYSKEDNSYTHFQSDKDQNNTSSNNTISHKDIDDLTEEDLVIDYVKKNKQLPDYYITKSEARNLGWVASKGNLCNVLPGRAIGGDKFSNREGQLPKGPQYFEADVNYNCGRRNADRIVYTKKGDVYLTKDHYKSFEKQ